MSSNEAIAKEEQPKKPATFIFMLPSGDEVELRAGVNVRAMIEYEQRLEQGLSNRDAFVYLVYSLLMKNQGTPSIDYFLDLSDEVLTEIGEKIVSGSYKSFQGFYQAEDNNQSFFDHFHEAHKTECSQAFKSLKLNIPDMSVMSKAISSPMMQTIQKLNSMYDNKAYKNLLGINNSWNNINAAADAARNSLMFAADQARFREFSKIGEPARLAIAPPEHIKPEHDFNNVFKIMNEQKAEEYRMKRDTADGIKSLVELQQEVTEEMAENRQLQKDMVDGIRSLVEAQLNIASEMNEGQKRVDRQFWVNTTIGIVGTVAAIIAAYLQYISMHPNQ